MATNSTISKAELQIADMDRHYYRTHALTIAQHPSETDERMMVRILAFALHAREALLFGKGLTADDEPDLWQKDLTGEIECWIDVGLPDEKSVRRASGRAKQVFIYSYGGRNADIWWDQSSRKLERSNNLTVINLTPETTRALAKLADRNMQLHCTIQDGQVLFANNRDTVEVEMKKLKTSSVEDKN